MDRKSTDAQIKASMKWTKKNMKMVPFSVRKGYYADVIKPAADAAGLPVNTFIRQAIDYYIASRDFEVPESTE